MPKKYKQSYSAPAKNSTYVHPSLSSNKPAPLPLASQASLSVNERIQQLRREQASREESQRKLELASASALPSVPPELRSILGVPEAIPPAPKPGNRPRIRLRTPGPAPPPSWENSTLGASSSTGGRGRFGAAASRTARKFRNVGERGSLRPRPACLASFSAATGERVIPKRSLMHSVLRKIAENWNDLDDEGLDFISGCPPYILSSLPSYLAYYGPDQALSINEVDALLRSGGDTAFLDLTALAGWCFPLKDLSRFVAGRQKQDHKREKITDTIVSESWEDDEADEPSTQQSHLTLRTVSAIRPLTITKLSLAMPPCTVTWSDLLTLTSYLPRLTHLSLASWPAPSKSTPTPTNTTLTSSMSLATSRLLHPSALDETQPLLRELSKQTYCLEYLDLSDCPWVITSLIPPCTILPPSVPSTHSRPSTTASWHDTSPARVLGVDWQGSWSLLTHLRIVQHPRPTALPHVPSYVFATTHPAGSSSSAASFIRQDLVAYLHRVEPMPSFPTKSTATTSATGTGRTSHKTASKDGGIGIGLDWRSAEYRTKTCAACGHILGSWDGCAGCVAWSEHCARLLGAWVENEVELREVARRVKRVRRGCVVDLGWMQV